MQSDPSVMEISSTILHSNTCWFAGSDVVYEGCPESVRPVWISWEPVAWPWCNLAASQRRPYCASVNSHSPVGLVSRQWDAIDWACVSHSQWPSEQISEYASVRLPIICTVLVQEVLFLAKHHITQVCQLSYSPHLAPCDLWLFQKLKSPLKVRQVGR